jgi:hypothetical protein
MLLAKIVNMQDIAYKARHTKFMFFLASLNCSNLQMVVIDEVDSFLFRPHVGLRAKYQTVCNIFIC